MDSSNRTTISIRFRVNLVLSRRNYQSRIKHLFLSIVENINAIDEMIEKHLVNYTLDGLNKVDKVSFV